MGSANFARIPAMTSAGKEEARPGACPTWSTAASPPHSYWCRHCPTLPVPDPEPLRGVRTSGRHLRAQHIEQVQARPYMAVGLLRHQFSSLTGRFPYGRHSLLHHSLLGRPDFRIMHGYQSKMGSVLMSEL